METPFNGYICNICNKKYSNRSGLWKHKDKTHGNQTSAENLPHQPKISHIKCRHCNKIFKHLQSRWKHEKKCSENDKDKVIEELKSKMLQMENQMSEILNKYAKIHPKTLQKMNKDLNANTNNGTIGAVGNNNTVIQNTYVKFGPVKLENLLDEKQKLSILNKQFLSLEESIKMIHFNDKLPEYNNIYITNMRDNLAYIYDGKKFISVDKNEVITTLINNHAEEIELLFDDNKNKLKDKISKRVEAFLELINNDDEYVDQNNKTHENYKAYKIGDIKRLLYDHSDIKKFTELRKQLLNSSSKCLNKEIEL